MVERKLLVVFRVGWEWNEYFVKIGKLLVVEKGPGP